MSERERERARVRVRVREREREREKLRHPLNSFPARIEGERENVLSIGLTSPIRCSLPSMAQCNTGKNKDKMSFKLKKGLEKSWVSWESLRRSWVVLRVSWWALELAGS